jgi:hypothetical protein
MSNLKVGRAKTATAGGVLAVACALLSVLFLSLGLTILSEEGYRFSASDIQDVVYTYIWCALILLGGILMLTRRYIPGGVLALICGILVAIGVWYLGIWGVIGGALGLVSKEKTPERVLEVAKLYGHVRIADLATKVGKTEADVELAIIKMQAKGQPIRFDATQREVIYG